MNKGITVLSLFDGLSGGQIALERAGIKVKKYYASEIDKYAMQITQKHYPNTIQLGDINNWKEWNIDVPDLILAGSPCQGFSNAGRGLNFDDPRSKLFFVFCDILAHYYPLKPSMKYLLENVKMKKIWQDIITDRMKVEPVLIDSALVSAQSRKRLYWANWKFSQPEDRHIYLKDIIVPDNEISDIYIYPKTHAGHLKHPNQKAGCLTGGAHSGGNHSDMTLLEYPQNVNSIKFVKGLEEGRRLHDGKNLSRNYHEGYRIYSTDGKSPSPSATPKGGAGGYTGLYQVGVANDIKGYDSTRRIYSSEGKSPTLTNMQGGHRQPKIATDETHYRKLLPIECERLQTVPEGYTEGVSNTQRYKMLGNGWTIDVIAHILSHMNKEQSL